MLAEEVADNPFNTRCILVAEREVHLLEKSEAFFESGAANGSASIARPGFSVAEVRSA
jgi:hypothetical protein